VLSASGAVNYRWNTGETTPSITVIKPDTYTVTGNNLRGCKKSVSFNVVEDPLPEVGFTTSPSTLDVRHNQLTCSVPAREGVLYTWEMGDGSTETGSTITHKYDVTYSLKEYKIRLKAVNANGCANESSQIVDIVPFIPNVFTPNGDGVNELFMKGFDLEVFDRYGTLLYKGNAGWDGTFKGKMMDNDSYFYMIHYADKYQKEQTRKGYVTLKK